MNTPVDPKTAAKGALATITPPVDAFIAEMLPHDSLDQLRRSLPAQIKWDVFERNLHNAIMRKPELMDYPPWMVFREVAAAAGLGLLLDPLLGEAYIVDAYNYKSKRKEPQLRIGYKGMVKLARQSGNVTSVYVHEVCENDRVECDLGHPKTLHIHPKLFGDRGSVTGYVAVISYKDGAFDFEPMSVDQTRGIRDRSDAWKAYKDEKIKSTPWSTDEDEMGKKTTLRRLMKRQDLSPEMRTAIEIEDRAEFPEMRALRSAVADDDGPPAPPPPGQIAHAPGEQVPMQPISETEAVELASSGLDDGRMQTWEDFPSEDEQPPSPNSAPPVTKGTSTTPAEQAAPAAASSPPTSAAGAASPLMSKGQLLKQISQINHVAHCSTWTHNYDEDLAALSEADRLEVSNAFNARVRELTPKGKK